jgi:hypothetical protein
VFFPESLLKDIQLGLHTELSELKHFNWGISEAYSLPIGQRKFHINQIKKRLEREEKAIKDIQKK